MASGDWIQDRDTNQRALFGCQPWGDSYKVPSEPTVRRVLQQIDVDALDTVLNQWVAEEEATHCGDGVAVDGKSL